MLLLDMMRGREFTRFSSTQISGVFFGASIENRIELYVINQNIMQRVKFPPPPNFRVPRAPFKALNYLLNHVISVNLFPVKARPK